MMARIPTSPTALEKPKNMFSTLFANVKGSSPRVSVQGIPPGEGDCLHDESLESAALTTIWRSSSSKLNANEKALLEALHVAYLSRTEALRGYQVTVQALTEELADSRMSNSALKVQLDVTSRAHASLLTEITSPSGRPPMSERDVTMSPESEGDDSGWWSDSGSIGAEDDTLTLARSASPARGLMRRGSSAAHWLNRRSASPGEPGDIKLLRKENMRLREEVERLEGVLEDCSVVLGGMECR